MTASEQIAPGVLETTAREPWRRVFNWHVVVVLAVVVFFAGIRWRLASMPLERDEGEYAYAGQLILQGIPPYQLAYNMKLPGTYTAYAATLAIFGQTARGIHLGLLLINSISLLLLYAVAARLSSSLAGVMACASYAFLSTQPGVYGFAAHATHFVVFAALIGLILLLSAEETKKLPLFFFSGFAFGIAFLMKQPGIFFGAFGFFYLATHYWPKDNREWKPWATQLGVFFCAAALPFAITCALLFRADVFDNFWFWTFSYARQYATAVSFSEAWALFKASFIYILGFTTPWPWIIALLGVFALFLNSSLRQHRAFIVGLMIFSFAAVCPGLHFRPHYFILFLPAVALLIALAVTSSIDWLSTRPGLRSLRFFPVLLFTAAWALALQNNARFYFKLSPLQATRLCYSLNPFPEAVQVAEYLRQHTAPTDRIMVFGSEPEIYFEAQRHSASGYIYTYSLGEDQPYWPTMQKQMMQEVEATRPAYVVLVNISFSWLLDPRSRQAAAIRSSIKQYVSTGFDQVGMVEVAEPESHYFWGEESQAHHHPGYEILIFKRKG
jgi:dolichyl-phosphate-mannose-protein mannosyltransferase